MLPRKANDHFRRLSHSGTTVLGRVLLRLGLKFIIPLFFVKISACYISFLDTFYIFSLVAAHTWVSIESWILNRLLKCRYGIWFKPDINFIFSQFSYESSRWLEWYQLEILHRCWAWFKNELSFECSWINLDHVLSSLIHKDLKSQKRWSVPTLVTLIFVIVKTTVHPNSCWLYIGSNTVWVWFAPEILITSFLLTQDRSKLWEESEIRLMSTLNLEQQKFLEVVFRLLYLRLRTLLAKSHFKNKKLRQKEDHGVLHINKNMRSGT